MVVPGKPSPMSMESPHTHLLCRDKTYLGVVQVRQVQLRDDCTGYPPEVPCVELLPAPAVTYVDEMDLGITAEAALAETERCFSCGLCFGCENCWMYCQNNCFKKVKELSPGHYFDVDLSACDGCKKCAEECPCGFLELY